MYPPKVHQFAYVTDEACTEDEILSMEIIIMKVHTDARGFFFTWFIHICLRSFQKPKLLLGVCSSKRVKKKQKNSLIFSK